MSAGLAVSERALAGTRRGPTRQTAACAWAPCRDAFGRAVELGVCARSFSWAGCVHSLLGPCLAAGLRTAAQTGTQPPRQRCRPARLDQPADQPFSAAVTPASAASFRLRAIEGEVAADRGRSHSPSQSKDSALKRREPIALPAGPQQAACLEAHGLRTNEVRAAGAGLDSYCPRAVALLHLWPAPACASASSCPPALQKLVWGLQHSG
jgi:hypothetical protein